MLLSTAAALLCLAGPASASSWSVSLAASATDVSAGSSVTLTASANQSVSGSGQYIDIFDQTTEAAIASCWKGSVCEASVSEAAGSHTFIAYVDSDPQLHYPPCCVQATSNTVTVTWAPGGGSGWSVALDASATDVPGGATVTLTATANQDVKNSGYYIDIADQTTGTLVGYCWKGSTCQVSVSEAQGSHTFIAYVDSDPYGQYPPCCVQASSNTVTVTWGQATSWSISLTSSATNVAAGSPATLTATANQSVSGTAYHIDVDDQTAGTVVGSCSIGSRCQVPVSESQAGSHTFIAYVDGDPVSEYPPCCVQAGSNTVTVSWGHPATGVLDVEFKAGGTLPTFPCPRGCQTTFSGSGTGALTAAGSAHAEEAGVGYTATFAIPGGSIGGTADYIEPAGNLCPLNGNASGTVTVSAPATGVIERTSTPSQAGSVTGVNLQLEYEYVRVGLTAAITITGGTATISYTFPDTGSGSLIGNVTGYVPGAFVVNPLDAMGDCDTSGGAPLDFTVAGDGALALGPSPIRAKPTLSARPPLR